jgi:hypothetical protein
MQMNERVLLLSDLLWWGINWQKEHLFEWRLERAKLAGEPFSTWIILEEADPELRHLKAVREHWFQDGSRPESNEHRPSSRQQLELADEALRHDSILGQKPPVALVRSRYSSLHHLLQRHALRFSKIKVWDNRTGSKIKLNVRSEALKFWDK